MWFFLIGLGCGAGYSSNQGEQALKSHDLPAAETQFRAALELDPKHGEALAGLGWTYHLAGKKDAALSVFQRCEQLDSENVSCLRGLGSIAIANGRLLEARSWVETAQRVDPNDPKVQSSVALLAMMEGRLTVAKENYQSLSNRFPTKAEYQLGLGETFFRLGEPQKSAEIAVTALELPETPKRYRAMLFALHARSLLKSTAGVEDPNDCERTAPPVNSWLTEAMRSVDQAIAANVDLPDIYIVQRQILRRQSMLSENCPGVIFEL